MMEEKGGECIVRVSVKSSFYLERAVCSYGFFMMSPNRWLSAEKTLYRPLRLCDETSVSTLICQISSSLLVRVFGISQLTHQDENHIKAQVVRMLRLSEHEDDAIDGFHRVHSQAKSQGFGRVFRSPTLFEDIVKAFLLCNCRWQRTLTMAASLCDLQSELKGKPLGWSSAQSSTSADLSFYPKTPTKTRLKKRECSEILRPAKLRFDETSQCKVMSGKISEGCSIVSEISITKCDGEYSAPNLGSSSKLTSNTMDTSELPSNLMAGNFPTPKEVASLSENYLTKRCGVGYRARRILNLAKQICNGSIDLDSLENPDGSVQMKLEDLKTYLQKLDGVGKFTCDVVLMCMGIYQCVPTDTETVRHLKQVVGRSDCTIKSVVMDVEEVYAKYVPFQFLAYWWEIWDSYEKQFGRLSHMPPSDYGLISGHNMKEERAVTSIDPDKSQESLL